MARRARLLVTGFGPFPRMRRNPSADLAKAVATSPRLRLYRIEAMSFVLTTAYGALPTELDPLLAAEPDILLLVGVAGRSAKVRIETRATSRRSTLFPDACGDKPARPEAGGEAVRHTRINVAAAQSALRARGIPARISRDAGRYLCNAAYFRALARKAPTVFVHIPKPPRASQRTIRHDAGRRRWVGPGWRRALSRALVDIALEMAREARRVAVRPAFR